MNITAFILFLFGLQLICLFLAKKFSKNLKTSEDYYLAGKSLKFFPLMMTFLATQVGGGLILGSAEEAFQFGPWVLFYPLGASLGLIILGLGIGRRLAEFKVSTIAQIFEKAYGSTNLKKLASILSIVSLFMVLIGQIIASKKFMLSLGVESNLLFIAFWGIVILYTALGGLKAVVASDMVQAGFFFASFLFAFFYAVFNNETQVFPSAVSLESLDYASTKICGWLILPLLFMTIEQDMGQRCFAAKSSKVVLWASVLAGLLTMFICVIPIYFGINANLEGIEFVKGSSVLMASVSYFTSPLIAALIGCAILVAIVSTADSLINAIGSNVAQDFEISWFKNVNASQAMTFFIALAAIFFAFFFDNVVDMLMLSYELSVSCLFVPIFAALFKRQGNYFSAVLAVAGGLIGFFLFRFVDGVLPRELASVLLSAAGYGLGELLALGRVKSASTF